MFSIGGSSMNENKLLLTDAGGDKSRIIIDDEFYDINPEFWESFKALNELTTAKGERETIIQGLPVVDN